MYLEHLVYSAALAIIVGMVYYRATGRDPSWIIIATALIPDLDLLAEPLSHLLHLGIPDSDRLILHGGYFHTLAALVLVSVILGLILKRYGLRFEEAFLFCAIGFGAHLFADALIYNTRWYLWPLYTNRIGIVIFHNYHTNLVGLADARVLAIGLGLLVMAAIIRSYFEGAGWVRHYIPESLFNNPKASVRGLFRIRDE